VFIFVRLPLRMYRLWKQHGRKQNDNAPFSFTVYSEMRGVDNYTTHFKSVIPDTRMSAYKTQ
jgi:hypothetical protein